MGSQVGLAGSHLIFLPGWDYADPHNDIQNILYSVLVGGKFVRMMVNSSHGVQENPNIPASYKGRVKIEGRA